MPIKSYLVHPHDGKKNELQNTLSSIDKCEVIPAENENLLILVTDTHDVKEDIELQEKLESIDSLKLIAMVSGFNSPKKN